MTLRQPITRHGVRSRSVPRTGRGSVNGEEIEMRKAVERERQNLRRRESRLQADIENRIKKEEGRLSKERKKIAKDREEMMQAKSKWERKQREIAEEKAHWDRFTRTRAHSRDNLAEFRLICSKLVREKEARAESVKQWKAEQVKAQERAAELRQLENQLCELQASVQKSKQELKESSIKAGEVIRLRQKYSDQMKELEKEKKVIATGKQELEAFRAGLKDEIEKLKTEKAGLTKSIEELREQRQKELGAIKDEQAILENQKWYVTQSIENFKLAKSEAGKLKAKIENEKARWDRTKSMERSELEALRDKWRREHEVRVAAEMGSLQKKKQAVAERAARLKADQQKFRLMREKMSEKEREMEKEILKYEREKLDMVRIKCEYEKKTADIPKMKTENSLSLLHEAAQVVIESGILQTLTKIVEGEPQSSPLVDYSTKTTTAGEYIQGLQDELMAKYQHDPGRDTPVPEFFDSPVETRITLQMPEILTKARNLPGKGTLMKSGSNFWSIRLCEEWQREFLSRYFTTEICINDSVQVQDHIIGAYDRAVAWGKKLGLSGQEIQTGFFTETTQINPSCTESQYLLLGYAQGEGLTGPRCAAGKLHEGAQVSFEVRSISTFASKEDRPRVASQQASAASAPPGTALHSNFATQWFFAEVDFQDFSFTKNAIQRTNGLVVLTCYGLREAALTPSAGT